MSTTTRLIRDRIQGVVATALLIPFAIFGVLIEDTGITGDAWAGEPL